VTHSEGAVTTPTAPSLFYLAKNIIIRHYLSVRGPYIADGPNRDNQMMRSADNQS
jgi:hypothetical protein